MKLSELILENKPPAKLFDEGSAHQIVGWVRDHYDDAEKAINVLNFWVMKQGKDLDKGRKAVLDFAIELLHKEFKNEDKLDGKLEEGLSATNSECLSKDLSPREFDQLKSFAARAMSIKKYDMFLFKFENLFDAECFPRYTDDTGQEIAKLTALGSHWKIVSATAARSDLRSQMINADDWSHFCDAYNNGTHYSIFWRR